MSELEQSLSEAAAETRLFVESAVDLEVDLLATLKRSRDTAHAMEPVRSRRSRGTYVVLGTAAALVALLVGVLTVIDLGDGGLEPVGTINSSPSPSLPPATTPPTSPTTTAAPSTTVAAPVAAVPATIRTIAIGGSQMLSAADELAAAGIMVDAIDGRVFMEAVERLTTLRADDRLGGVVVIALETSGPIAEEAAGLVMDTLVEVEHVVVLTNTKDQEWTAGNNSMFMSLAAQYPNATVLDWAGLASACPGDCLADDGILLGPDGQKFYADLIEAEITRLTGSPTRPVGSPPFAVAAMGSASATTNPAILPSDHRFSANLVVGDLDPGNYAYYGVDGECCSVAFTVPAGWTWNGQYLSKGGVDQPDGAAIYFYMGAMQIPTDPCHWATGPAADRHGIGVATALAAQPMKNATMPTNRPTTSRTGNGGLPGTVVERAMPQDVDFATCDDAQHRSWGAEDLTRPPDVPGQRDVVWAVDIAGPAIADAEGNTVIPASVGGLVIDATTFPGTPEMVTSEIDAILESIYVGHFG